MKNQDELFEVLISISMLTILLGVLLQVYFGLDTTQITLEILTLLAYLIIVLGVARLVENLIEEVSS